MNTRRRWAVLALLVMALASGATTVYLVGSHNRESDRQSALRYEAAVLAEVREMTVIAGALADAADAFAAKRLSTGAFLASVREWSATLKAVATRIEAIDVPAPFGTGEKLFAPAARTYARAADLYIEAGACRPATLPVGTTCVTVGQANNVASDALALYRRAAALLQRTRLRLGLGESPNFSDSPR